MRRTDRKPGPAPTGPAPDLERLAASAVEAARAFEAQRAAFKDEMEAEEALLACVVAVVRPALPAIVTLMPAGGLRGALAAVGNGSVLYLREDAVFVELFVVTSTMRLRPRGPPRTFPDLRTVLLDWDPEPIIRSLARLVDAQVTGRGPSTVDARTRAEKLTAVAKLLEEA